MTFVPCPKCHRHLRSTETACVFCGASLALATPARSVGAPVVLLGAAAAAIALAACDPKSEPPTAPIEPPTTNAPPSTSAPSTPTAPAPAPSETAAAPTPSATTAPSSTTAATPTTPHPSPSADIRPAMRYGLAPRKP